MTPTSTSTVRITRCRWCKRIVKRAEDVPKHKQCMTRMLAREPLTTQDQQAIASGAVLVMFDTIATPRRAFQYQYKGQ